MIKIRIYPVTMIGTNCSYIVDEATGKAAVTDPGEKSEELISRIREDGGRLEYVLLTHGHYDHICFAKQLADMFGAKVVTGAANAEFLQNTEYNGTRAHGIDFTPFEADILLNDGDKFMLGETEFTYITTPGHTKGCGVFIADGVMFAGDTLFCESYGRTDLPTGDEAQMVQSLKKLKELDGDYQVIPGHGPMTTLEHERRYNPLMRML
ncbi:MAG: MBL fold metallo-hydrolase [Ruminococcus sp.]|nr:MBL fold metallo-hydrolase [Ruminococcus sp.]